MYHCVGPFPHFSWWDVVSCFAEVQLPSGFLSGLQFTPEDNPPRKQGRWAAHGERSQGRPPKPYRGHGGVAWLATGYQTCI